MANYLEIDDSEISKYERGDHVPRLERFHLMAQCFGVNLADLFTNVAAVDPLPPDVMKVALFVHRIAAKDRRFPSLAYDFLKAIASRLL